MTTRRDLLQYAGAAAALAAAPETSAAAPEPAARRIGLAVSTYSYWHFKKVKYPIENVIEDAARLGFDGVEILHKQMTSESTEYMNRLKQAAFDNGLGLPFFSIHQDFVDPDPKQRRKAIDHTKHCLELARQMGIPAMRLNTGRWGTSGSFDALMAAGGAETPLEGYTNKDAFQWCVDSIRECLPAAEKAGVLMALENHWGLSTNPDTLLGIHDAVNSPWLGINMDTGNFAKKYGDTYEQMEKLAPHANIVQAKTYYGGGVWYTLHPDFKRIAAILRKAGFHGWVSLEMEGKEPAETAVPKSLRVLRQAFG